jgi:hypothetical protein
MRLILMAMNIRSNHGSGIIILVIFDGRRENGIFGIYEVFSRLIDEDFTLSPQETSGKVIERRYN